MLELTLLSEESSLAIKQRFASSSFSEEELEEVPFSSQAMCVFLCLVLFLNFFSGALSLWD